MVIHHHQTPAHISDNNRNPPHIQHLSEWVRTHKDNKKKKRAENKFNKKNIVFSAGIWQFNVRHSHSQRWVVRVRHPSRRLICIRNDLNLNVCTCSVIRTHWVKWCLNIFFLFRLLRFCHTEYYVCVVLVLWICGATILNLNIAIINIIISSLSSEPTQPQQFGTHQNELFFHSLVKCE